MAYSYPYSDASEETKIAVWKKGSVIQEYDQNVWRRDVCSHAIKYSEHGEATEFGWEIDHIKPEARGGSDDLINLQPLWWHHNRQKSDTYPWQCP